jgi:hypothetical protein
MALHLRPLFRQLTIKSKNLDQRKYDLDYIDPDPTVGDFGWAQRPYVDEVERQYNDGKPVRIIVLKARQLGISTATEAILFLWNFLHPGTSSGVLAHEDTPAQGLFEMMKLYWDTWPHKGLYNLKYGTRRQMQWLETRSNVRVGTAKNPEGFRGSTIHALHASEVAFWPDAGTLWTGLSQAIPKKPRTFIVLESTANGVGNWYHDMWNAAVEGDVDFVPMFFPWFGHSEYRAFNSLSHSDLNSDERQLFLLSTIQTYDSVRPLSEDEAMAAVAWRRWKIRDLNGDVNKFRQEFPSTPEEAFLTTGNPIFPHESILECYRPQRGARGAFYRAASGRVVFKHDSQGPWVIFRQPSADVRPDKYFVAGDPSETIVGDPCCIQILNRQSLEQVAVFNTRMNPVAFADQMILGADFYHHAMVCPEVEGGGQATIGAILAKGYDNVWADHRPDRMRSSINVYGWSTNYQRKQWAIGELQKLLLDNSIVIHDKLTYVELTNYVQRDDGTYGNGSSSTHDDAVMALAIAITASKAQGLYLPYGDRQYEPVDIYTSELDNVDNVVPFPVSR